MEYVRNVLKGIVIGIANAIPGVSGGTMMVIMKVFDRIMGAVSLNIKKLKENFLFLLTIFTSTTGWFYVRDNSYHGFVAFLALRVFDHVI